MRNKDITYLHSLGPYACAMMIILANSEENREDKLTPGQDIENDEYNIGEFKECFILFRGGAMKQEWIQ